MPARSLSVFCSQVYLTVQEIMARLLLIGLLAMFAKAVPVNAQTQVELEAFGLNNGLSDRIVRVIFRDRQGFLWIGTRNGLNRFDGRNFQVYDSYRPAPYRISSDDIATIAQLRNRKLVVAYHGEIDGFDLLDPSTGKLTPINLPESIQIEQILPTRAGDLFLIARQNEAYSFWRLDEVGTKLLRLAALPADYHPGPAHADAAGNIWMTTQHAGGLISVDVYNQIGKKLRSLHASNFVPALEKGAVSVDFFQTSKGEIWLILGQIGVYVYNKKANRFLLMPALPRRFDFLILQEDLLGNTLIQTLDKAGLAMRSVSIH